jgi:hypothetical protein
MDKYHVNGTTQSGLAEIDLDSRVEYGYGSGYINGAAV